MSKASRPSLAPSTGPRGRRTERGSPTSPLRHSAHGYLTVANADGSNQKRLIDTPVFWLTPHWSPDGTMIVVHTQQIAILADLADR